ncbi:MAG: thermonuclease family protein [Planctomycetaceae bacterium]
MNPRRIRHALLVTIFLLGSWLIAAPPKVIDVFSGKVVGVTDGDTITVLVNNQSVKVRLEGIDAPESGQSFGSKSKLALSALVFAKQVTVKKTGEDKYGRTLGVVSVGNVDANAKMIQDGWAWHYKEYNDEDRLAKLELEARAAKRGLWAETNALAPWSYRARKALPQTRQAVAPTTAKVPRTPPPTPQVPRTPPTTPQVKPAETTATYWLNTSSGVRHNARCQYFKNTKNGRPCGPNDGKACGICGG